MGMCAGAPPGREPLLAAGADALDRPHLEFPQPAVRALAAINGVQTNLKQRCFCRMNRVNTRHPNLPTERHARKL
jgi:hypothetical protein